MAKSNIQHLFEVYPSLVSLNKKLNGSLEKEISFKKFDAGALIKTREMECSGILLVLKGTIKIEKVDEEGKQTRLYELGSGEICHESLSCFMKCQPLDLVGYALSSLEIALIPMKLISEHMIYDVDFLRFMYTNLYAKFSKVVLDKEELTHESIPDRLIKYLKKQNSPIIYTTHQEIALNLGTAREVISRNLKKMEQDGLVKLERNKIKLLNL